MYKNIRGVLHCELFTILETKTYSTCGKTLWF